MRRLPFSLLFAAALLIITMAIGSYVDLRYEEMHGRQLAISTGLEKIDRFNQQLSTMLLISLLERNILKSSSYQNVHSKLELNVRIVEKLTQGLNLASDIMALSEERRNLRQVELKAYELMQQEQWEKAHPILFGDDYSLAQKIYEINSETAIGALTGELTAIAKTFNRIRLMTLILRFAALCLLLWAGLIFSKRLQRELAEQERLKEAIGAANIQLEEKVQERTVELEEANQELERLSNIDGLTQLHNRRYFDHFLDAEWKRAERENYPISIIFCDIDYFKNFNDTYGHQAGDSCLIQVAQAIEASMRRPADLAARYGGEEFVAVLSNTDKKGAMKVAEDIHDRIRTLQIDHSTSEISNHVSISIGVSLTIPNKLNKKETLVEKADQALYTAKQNGRNQIRFLDIAG